MKSAYYLAYQISSVKEASGSNYKGIKERWRSIWQLDILPKTKICLGRILNNFVPSKSNLISKGMDINPWCLFCKKSWESTVHVLWGCKQIRNLWIDFFSKLKDFNFMCRGEGDSTSIWESLRAELIKEELEDVEGWDNLEL